MRTFTVRLASVPVDKKGRPTGQPKRLPATSRVSANTIDDALDKTKRSLRGRGMKILSINCAADDTIVAYVKD